MFDGNLLLFFTRPICLVLIGITMLSTIVGCVREYRMRAGRKGKALGSLRGE